MRSWELCVAALIFMLLVLPGIVTADQPSVIVSNYTVTPAVVQPGDLGTITVVLTNTATAATRTEAAAETVPGQGQTTTTTNTQINAVIEDATLKGDGIEVLTGSYGRIGALGPGQSARLTFLFRAPAEDGIYFPEVWVRVAGATSLKYPVPVNVNSGYAIIKKPAIRIERSVPESVIPGQPFNLTLVVANDGQAAANDVTVNVNASTSSITAATPQTFYIPRLAPGEEAAREMRFLTDTGTALGLQPILITVAYQNNDGNLFREVSTVGVPIQGKAELGVASVSTDPTRITVGDPIDLIIRVENSGTGDANSVRATIDGLPLQGGKEAFMGTIEPNNDAPAVFTLTADEAGTFDYTLLITYTDDFGTHTMEERLQMAVADSDDTLLLIAAAAIVIVAAVVAVWWWRRRRREEEEME
ncbi:S-layer protein [Methanoculleus taiwanensis]|uniref:S-layer protein n=1 Tax=Methanoculleus taiwanensis TaxID=1550565 RepID=A0A498H3S2_9EURY|nr:CARDB domain-containing protein [Methanoculleus taiwanensis]RXE56700.1 S-layer protein [Methanoculleus taiwanensis]